MKKTFFEIAMLALIVSTIMSACGKDDLGNTAKDNPIATHPSTERTWPANALMTDLDTFLYDAMGNQVSMHRSDVMLAVYYTSNTVLSNLPNGFCPVMPVEQSINAGPGMPNIQSIKGLVVLFEGIDRTAAINQLKNIEGVYAIEPVYGDGDISFVPTPRFQVILNSVEDTVFLFNIADSLAVSRIPVSPDHEFMYGADSANIWCSFFCDHSLVNSVTAANKIWEAGNGRVITVLYDAATYQHDSI